MKINQIVNYLIINFVLIIIFFVLGRNTFRIAVILSLMFLILGIYLIHLTHKRKIKEKKFLLMIGSSGTIILLGTILHNLFYAIGIYSEMLVFEWLHGIFFIISIIIAPIIFVIGLMGYKWKNI